MFGFPSCVNYVGRAIDCGPARARLTRLSFQYQVPWTKAHGKKRHQEEWPRHAWQRATTQRLSVTRTPSAVSGNRVLSGFLGGQPVRRASLARLLARFALGDIRRLGVRAGPLNDIKFPGDATLIREALDRRAKRARVINTRAFIATTQSKINSALAIQPRAEAGAHACRRRRERAPDNGFTGSKRDDNGPPKFRLGHTNRLFNSLRVKCPLIFRPRRDAVNSDSITHVESRHLFSMAFSLQAQTEWRALGDAALISSPTVRAKCRLVTRSVGVIFPAGGN